MMPKAEAETFIRSRAIDWMRETTYVPKVGHYPDFADFKHWLRTRDEEACLRFRSIDADDEAQRWFEAAIKSYWRNNRREE